jgi:DNA-binding NtrC family response regulator
VPVVPDSARGSLPWLRGAPGSSNPAGGPLILILADDWRTRRFICTVLKYKTNAYLIEAVSPHAARSVTRDLRQPIDLLISELEWADGTDGMDLASEIAAGNPSMKVLLMSLRSCPPSDAPPEWRFLSTPFPTGALLHCVSELFADVK